MYLKKILARLGPFLGLIFVYVLFAVISPPEFLSFYNAKTILTQTVIVGIAALGMTLVIISAGIDLSAGSLVSLGTVLIAISLKAGWSPGLSAVIGVAGCALFGLINGAVISGFRIVPFIVTLGTMQIARGLSKYLSNEQTVVTPPNGLQQLMLVDPTPSWLVFAPGIWVLLILLILVTLMLRYTVLGRHIFAIGSNEETARLCGIHVKGKKMLIYTLGAAFTGVASIFQYGNLTVGDPTAAVGMELDIIAAVVIGGGSLNGGEGSAMGSIVGALIMAVLRNGCNMLGVPNYVQEIIIGFIIVGAVMVDKLKHRGA